MAALPAQARFEIPVAARCNLHPVRCQRGGQTTLKCPVFGENNTDSLHEQALQTLRGFYDLEVMSNVHRPTYVECLVAALLAKARHLMYDWAPWDLEHESGARLEVKQAAARQTWHKGDDMRPNPPRFDIAPRTGYWTKDNQWIDRPGRSADIHVFAWHPETLRSVTDQRRSEQWRFFVLRTETLPDQKSIGLAYLERLAESTPSEALASTVERMLPRSDDTSGQE